MPQFEHSTSSAAPPEEVWKLLYDPARFTEWWVGMRTAQVGDGEFVFVQDDVPDFPIPHRLQTRRDRHSVLISCRLHDLVFDWRLAPGPGGAGTRISVHAEAPETKADVLARQEPAIRASVERLAELATSLGH
jgi:uncharacterized protein YndB with AHSA1/START domain